MKKKIVSLAKAEKYVCTFVLSVLNYKNIAVQSLDWIIVNYMSATVTPEQYLNTCILVNRSYEPKENNSYSQTTRESTL